MARRKESRGTSRSPPRHVTTATFCRENRVNWSKHQFTSNYSRIYACRLSAHYTTTHSLIPHFLPSKGAFFHPFWGQPKKSATRYTLPKFQQDFPSKNGVPHLPHHPHPAVLNVHAALRCLVQPPSVQVIDGSPPSAWRDWGGAYAVGILPGHRPHVIQHLAVALEMDENGTALRAYYCRTEKILSTATIPTPGLCLYGQLASSERNLMRTRRISSSV